jgi:transcription-repair coupling factor (superfamily II helicase)
MTYEDHEDKEIVRPLGWRPLSDLGQSERHLLINYKHENAYVMSFQGCQNEIYELDNSKVVFLCNENDDPSALYDFRSGQPVCIGGNGHKGLHPTEAKSAFDMETLPEMLELIERKSNIFYDDVYNIEVEEFHTYFVGEAGIWVHNTANVAA